jgi:hypothetical protein
MLEVISQRLSGSKYLFVYIQQLKVQSKLNDFAFLREFDDISGSSAVLFYNFFTILRSFW